jgi:hypothetical protein
VCLSACGVTRLAASEGQSAAAAAACLVDQQLDRVAAERRSPPGGEERLVGLALAFLQPLAQDGDALAGEGGAALLAALAAAAHVRAARGQHGVADAQADQLGETQAGLERELQERVVAAAEPASAVGGGK